MVESEHHTGISFSGKLSRRQLLKTTAKASAVLLVPAIIPSSALGLNGAVPPSERIILGGQGVGNRGSHDLKRMLLEPGVQFVAICDAKRSQRMAIKALADEFYDNQDCKMYSNIPEFLATRTDIDAILTATGDRWHATSATLAMRAGKDVYSEKPSSMTIAEGQAVVETAKRYGRVYQTGTQRLSEENFVFANELVRTGRLGEVHTVRAHIAPWDAAEMSYEWLPEEPQPPKEEVDWDAWLGPCPWRPFNSAYIKGGWRGHYDFHTSCIGEWGAHTFAQCQHAIDSTNTSAIEYEYVNNESGDGMVTKFPNGIRMVLEREGTFHGSCAVRYEGTEGWVEVGDGYAKPDVSRPALMADFEKIVDDYIARTQRPCRGEMRHIRDFFECVRSRRLTIANPEVMHRSMTTVHCANICMWLKRNMKYDPVKEEFIDDPEANRLRSRAQREPWII